MEESSINHIRFNKVMHDGMYLRIILVLYVVASSSLLVTTWAYGYCSLGLVHRTSLQNIAFSYKSSFNIPSPLGHFCFFVLVVWTDPVDKIALVICLSCCLS